MCFCEIKLDFFLWIECEVGKGLNNCLTWLFYTGLELWGVVCDECCFIVWRVIRLGFWIENVPLYTRAHAYVGGFDWGFYGLT